MPAATTLERRADPVGQTVGRPAPADRSARSARRFVALGYLVPLLVRIPLLWAPPVDRHAFRQTQTLLTARVFRDDGISLFHPKLPIFGRPWEVPFEFPLYQAVVAIVSRVAHVSIAFSGRLVALCCYVASLVLLRSLLRRVASPTAVDAALISLHALPFVIVWSVATLIEFPSVALGLAGTALMLRGVPGSRRAVTTASLLGVVAWSLAGAVKITTAIATLAFFVALSWPHLRTRVALVRVALASGGAVIAGGMWTHHADAIKQASTTTRWLTSDALQGFNFGTAGQRVAPDTWTRLIGILWWVAIPIALAGLLRLARAQDLAPEGHGGAGRARMQRVPFLVAAVAFLAGWLVFTNLFFRHDYYWAESIPAMALVGALAFEGVGHVRAAALTLAGVLLTSTYLVPTIASFHWNGMAIAGSEIHARCDGDVVLARDTWSSDTLYYAQRRGFIATSVKAWEASGERPADYSCLVVWGRAPVAPALRRHFTSLVASPAWGRIYVHRTGP